MTGCSPSGLEASRSILQGEAAYIFFGCCPPGRLGTANSNVQHGPGEHTGFSAQFDSRYAIATDRPRAVLKHSCIRAPKGGLPHGACCSRATSKLTTQRTLSQNKSKTKIVDSMVEILSGPAHQGLSIEPSTTLSTALLETTELFKTLDFWVRNLDLVGALRLNYKEGRRQPWHVQLTGMRTERQL